MSDDFIITHRAGQPTEADTSKELAGAVLVSPEDDGPDYYRTITLAELDYYLESGDVLIYGNELEIIENQLLQRHPSPPGTSSLLFQQHYKTPRQSRLVNSWGGRRRRRYSGNADDNRDDEGQVWVLLPRPFVDTEDRDVLRERIAEVGPVLIEDKGGDHERWRKHGFTVAARHPDLLQVNFSPARVKDTFFKRATADYATQMRGYFPYDAMRELWYAIQQGPVNLPYSRVLTLGNKSRQYGEEPREDPTRYRRGRRTSDDRSACIGRCADWGDDILEGLAVVKRLKPGVLAGWYRDNSSFRHGIAQSLPWLHGVEALMRQPEEQRNTSPLWVSSDNAKTLLAVCRFIRREAKILGLEIPPKPQPPRPPKAASSGKKRRAASKGSEAKARRLQTTSTELALPADRTL